MEKEPEKAVEHDMVYPDITVEQCLALGGKRIITQEDHDAVVGEKLSQAQ